jgi:hypothetical protein
VYIRRHYFCFFWRIFKLKLSKGTKHVIWRLLFSAVLLSSPAKGTPLNCDDVLSLSYKLNLPASTTSILQDIKETDRAPTLQDIRSLDRTITRDLKANGNIYDEAYLCFWQT